MAESESCRSGDKSAVENAESATKDAEKMLWKKLKKLPSDTWQIGDVGVKSLLLWQRNERSDVTEMQVWFNGRTSAFQAEYVGSIPITCFVSEDT